MSQWSIKFSLEAEKDISSLDKPIRKRILEKIDWLEKNFGGILPSVLIADFRDYFKLRVGDWRVFYQVNWNRNIITIQYIDHRSRAYKTKKK